MTNSQLHWIPAISILAMSNHIFELYTLNRYDSFFVPIVKIHLAILIHTIPNSLLILIRFLFILFQQMSAGDSRELCGKCLERYDPEIRQPVALECGHSFCRQCLIELNSRNHLNCPDCKYVFYIKIIISISLVDRCSDGCRTIVFLVIHILKKIICGIQYSRNKALCRGCKNLKLITYLGTFLLSQSCKCKTLSTICNQSKNSKYQSH